MFRRSSRGRPVSCAASPPPPPLGAAESCPTYFHFDGKSTWRPFLAKENRVIESAWRLHRPFAELHFSSNPEGAKDFQVRFGPNAVSKRLKTRPETGIIQVNVKTGATRLVRRGCPSLPEGGVDSGKSQPSLERSVSSAAEKLAIASRRCKSACAELVESEERYVETLRVLSSVFYSPLRAWAAEELPSDQSGGVTPDEIDDVFGHVETLYKINAHLCEELRNAASASSGSGGETLDAALIAEAVALAAVLKEAAGHTLKLYAPHVKMRARSAKLAKELREGRARYSAVVRVLELQPGSRESLESLLHGTVQRLPRYLLLLREISKHVAVIAALGECVGRGADAAAARLALDELQEASSRLAQVTSSVDSAIGDAEGRERALTIATDVLRVGEEHLFEWRTRRLLFEGAPLVKIMRSKTVLDFQGNVRRSPRRGFLFNDLLIMFSVNSGNCRQYALHELLLIDQDRTHSPLAGTLECWHLEPLHEATRVLGLCDSMLSAEDFANSFVVCAGGVRELVSCATKAEREAWVASILSAVDKLNPLPAASGDLARSLTSSGAAKSHQSHHISVKLARSGHLQSASGTPLPSQETAEECSAVLKKLLSICKKAQQNTAGPISLGLAYS